MIGYPPELLRREVAVIAAHFHWPLETLLTLEHAERRRWVAEIAAMRAEAARGPGG